MNYIDKKEILSAFDKAGIAYRIKKDDYFLIFIANCNIDEAKSIFPVNKFPFYFSMENNKCVINTCLVEFSSDSGVKLLTIAQINKIMLS